MKDIWLRPVVRMVLDGLEADANEGLLANVSKTLQESAVDQFSNSSRDPMSRNH